MDATTIIALSVGLNTVILTIVLFLYGDVKRHIGVHRKELTELNRLIGTVQDIPTELRHLRDEIRSHFNGSRRG